ANAANIPEFARRNPTPCANLGIRGAGGSRTGSIVAVVMSSPLAPVRKLTDVVVAKVTAVGESRSVSGRSFTTGCGIYFRRCSEESLPSWREPERGWTFVQPVAKWE